MLEHAQVDADDRLHARGLRGLEELHHREQIALVGERDGGHLRRRDRIHQPGHAFAFALNAHHAVDQRVLGVQVEVNEHARHRLDLERISGNDWRSQARRTGSKLRRWMGVGPSRSSAS